MDNKDKHGTRTNNAVMDYDAHEPDRRNVRTDFRMSVVLAILATVIYGATLTKGVFPGLSARLLGIASGLDHIESPAHSIFLWVGSWLSALPVFSLPTRLGLFSMVCGVCAVVLVYRVVSFFVRDVITEETSYNLAPRASTMAGAVAAVAFLFTVPAWSAATRFQFQCFDVLFPLLAAQMMVWFARSRRRVFLVLFVVICSVGVVESPTVVPMLPMLMAFAVYVLWRAQKLSFLQVAWMLVLMLVLTGTFFSLTARHFFASVDIEAMGFKKVSDVMVRMLAEHGAQLRAEWPRRGLLLLVMMGVLPWLTAIFASFRGLNNERSASQYVLHFLLSALVVVSLVNTPAFSPSAILKAKDQLPVGLYAMIAMTAGYLFAYWYLLLKVRRSNRAFEVTRFVRQTGEWMGILCAYPFMLIVVIASLLNTFECANSTRGTFADRCAKEILDRMDGRTWLVTDGTLDTHLQVLARRRGQELNLICLQKDTNKYYLKTLWDLIEERNLFDDPERQQKMKSTLERLGALPFVQDWFDSDEEVEKKVAVFGFPDLLFAPGLTPAPNFFFFVGSRDVKTLAQRPLLDEYMAFWNGMDAILSTTQPSRNSNMDDLTNRIRRDLRRHMGFVANNLGVMLEETGNEKDAFTIYNYVWKTIDPENISALFNRFEMTRRDVAASSAYKDRIEKEMKDFLAKIEREKIRYPLWSLSRYFGYVRSPELFARLGYTWAVSGQTTAAKASIDKIFVTRVSGAESENQRMARLQAIANMLTLTGDKDKTAEIYTDILANDPNNQSALFRLARLALQEGATKRAEDLLTRLTTLDSKPGIFGVEWATIHLMNNDLTNARVVLQETTDLQPKNLQAWSMLALLQIQQGEIDDVEKVILNRMQNIAGGIDDYFVQVTIGQIALAKLSKRRAAAAAGELAREPNANSKDLVLQRQAREAFIRAGLLRPEITGVKDIILQLDIAMNDGPAADLHARRILRADRNHALANYVMGSLRLQEGAYGEAEEFLTRSVKTAPTAAALNDLAEVLRRIKKLPEAEAAARQAVVKEPSLYVAWETLGSILVDQNKTLDEAEQMVKKALELFPDDPRVKITLAKIQLRTGDIERARATIQQVKQRQNDLAKFDQDELAKLVEDAAAFKRK